MTLQKKAVWMWTKINNSKNSTILIPSQRRLWNRSCLISMKIRHPNWNHRPGKRKNQFECCCESSRERESTREEHFRIILTIFVNSYSQPGVLQNETMKKLGSWWLPSIFIAVYCSRTRAKNGFECLLFMHTLNCASSARNAGPAIMARTIFPFRLPPAFNCHSN